MTEEAVQRPPLGVMPRETWVMKRAQDLARAIHAYTDDGIQKNLDVLDVWTAEFAQIIDELKHERESA